MKIALYLGKAFFSLIGNTYNPSNALRPFVSINLEFSGYRLVLNDGTGGEKYKITKETE